MISSRLQRATLVLCIAAIPALAGAAASSPAPAKVMMFGVFHFANPGQDIVKTDVINVMTKDNQAYLEGLATRLASFHPSDVLVECNPSEQVKIDEKYSGYAKGTVELTSNELFQIGFRVAKLSGIDKVTCFNEDTIGWDAQPMFDYIKKNDPAMQASMDAVYKSMSERDNREQATLSLPQLLKSSNDSTRDRNNMDLYIATNAADAGRSFAGADATASWWHRNFRMYANVQKAAIPGHRVLVIAGQGHTAILKQLLAIDQQRQSEDATGYLAP